MLTSGIIDLAIGLTFVFGVTAALASFVTELVARFLGMRAEYLLQGLRELLDTGEATTELKDVAGEYKALTGFITGKMSGSPPEEKPKSATGALLGSPILTSQGMVGQISSRHLTLGPKTTKSVKPAAAGSAGAAASAAPAKSVGRPATLAAISGEGRWLDRARLLRSLPSYISGSSFADAVIDVIVPNAENKTTMDTIRAGVANMPGTLPALKQSLEALVKDAGDDVIRFRTSLEKWYDDHMDRVSGWYKRRVAIITLVFGAILVVLLNLNALTIGRTMYTESAVGAAISTLATKGPPCPNPDNQQECLANLAGQISAAATAGLPIGWGTVRDCTEPTAHCNWWDRRGIFSQHGGSFGQLLLVIIGFLIMIIAIVPGAQFWFGLLTKLNTLRATGPKPSTPASNSVNLIVTSPSPPEPEPLTGPTA